MAASLTAEVIRSLSTPQSYERGRQLYRGGAIFDAACQGNLLLGKCEGNSEPFYTLQVEIDAGGVRSAMCSCPYDWGGICKHLVALLLAYVHAPDDFARRQNIPDLLKDLDRQALVDLLARLVEKDPELYDGVEAQALDVRGVAQARRAPAATSRQTQVSEQEYRRRVKTILSGTRGYRSSEMYWMTSSIVQELDQVRATAYRFLEAGDAQGALVILMALLEEVAEAYERFDDSEGDLGDFLGELGEALAETILSQDLSLDERRGLEERLTPIVDELEDYGIEDVQIALQALEDGWSALSLDEEEGVEDGWPGDLTRIKLNVLERQGRVDEFLELCQAAGEHLRLAEKLLELGRKDEAVQVAMSHLTQADEALSVARRLRDRGHLQEAIALGERGLSLGGHKHNLGTWLGPLEEAQGRKEDALLAYRLAFNSSPSLELYQTLQRLSGLGWEALRLELISTLKSSSNTNVLVEVYMHEKNWEAAIRLADANRGNFRMLERVADAVTPYQPEWVIRISLSQSDELIARTQSKLYPAAGAWLARAKKAYAQMGRQDEWQAHLNGLKLEYSRRPALQQVLRGL